MKARDERVNGVFWLLRVTLGAAMLLAGVDKFFDLLTTWSMYLSPLAESLLPVSGEVFLRAVGVVEVALGLAILSRWPRLGAYAASAWLVAIAVNLGIAGHFWDLVVRDLEVAASAFALARLAEWRAAAAADAAPVHPHPALRHQGARV
jgi:uncharacterized membrane protein YphA (DoxX/SURF4 family)